MQGVLLQIFTQPISDRPTVFLEIIQRIGCMTELSGSAAAAVTGSATETILSQAGGCGGVPFPLVTQTRKAESDCAVALRAMPAPNRHVQPELVGHHI